MPAERTNESDQVVDTRIVRQRCVEHEISQSCILGGISMFTDTDIQEELDRG